MWIWLLTNQALATPLSCDATAEKESFDFLLLRAEQAIGMLDPEELGESTDKARSVVKCLEVELTRTEVARLYRLSGIARYVNDDLVEAVKDFTVARALDPEATVDPALGKPLRQTYEAVPPPTGEMLDLPKPEEGWLDIDGERSDVAPADRSYFLQWVRDDGLPHGTWLVAKGEIPPYPTRGGSADTGGGGGGGSGKALLISGIVSGVVGGGGMVGAYVLDRKFAASPDPSGKLGGLIMTNRVLSAGGIGLGVAGAGLVGASFAVGF